MSRPRWLSPAGPAGPAGPAEGPGSLRRQLVVLSAAVTAAAAVLLTLLVQLVLARTSTSSVDRVLEDRAESVASAVRAVSTGGLVVVPPSVLDAGVAVYDGSGALVAGSAPGPLASTYAELSTVSRGPVTREVDDRGRVRAEPIFLGPGTGQGARAVVVVTERLQPYEKAERDALVVSIVTGLLAVLASAALAAWVSRRALAPVVEMAGTADEWSEHDLDRRFALTGPSNELTALGRVLDGLLDKVSSAIRSEQRLTSELAHELRTPLTAVQGTADLMLLRPGLDDALRADVEEVRAAARRMAETITGLLALARSASAPHDGVLTHLATALDEVARHHDRVRVDVGDVVVGMPETLVLRAVGPVVDNAVRAGEHVSVTVVPGPPGRVAIAVDDDGPGVPEGERERIFEAGHSVGPHGGSGLGLSLARRIARTAGGDVRLQPHAEGTRFVVELPRG